MKSNFGSATVPSSVSPSKSPSVNPKFSGISISILPPGEYMSKSPASNAVWIRSRIEVATSNNRTHVRYCLSYH